MLIALIVLGAPQSGGAQQTRPSDPGPAPESYIRWSLLTDPGALVPPGELTLAGRKMSCLDRPTILNPYLPDYGAAFPRFIVLNPKKMARAPPSVQFWLYGHECGHETLGPDEDKADCFGIEKGVREHWLTPDGLDQICAFIQAGSPDGTHKAGPERCQAMRACYAQSRRNGRSRH